MNQNELSLYLHIPFCEKKCDYCDFLSAPADKITRDSYVRALLGEIDSYRESGLSQRKLISVFLGGGTPSVLSGEDISSILQEIKTVFNVSKTDWEQAEITMEMNPGTVTMEKCRQYYAAGINRISIGLQSADDRELQRLGRIHDYQTFLQTYHSVREAGFENVNIDLMSALPGQTVESYRQSLEKVIALAPEHISAYSLIIEEGTPFYDRYGQGDEGELPDEDAEREMYQLTGTLFKEAGYHRYEISNYAREGKECRHNCVYWRRGDYLGLGLGASSLIGHMRYKNTSALRQYIEFWQDRQGQTFSDGNTFGRYERALYDGRYQCELCKLTSEDEMAEFMFLGLRMMEGVSPAEFYRCFGRKMLSVYGETIRKYVSLGMLAWRRPVGGACRDKYTSEIGFEDDEETVRLCLTEKGIDVSNVIFADFLSE